MVKNLDPWSAEFQFHVWPDFLDCLLDVQPGTVATSLGGLHSLINFSDSDSKEHPSQFHHGSFRDFLLDPIRSKSFYICDAQHSKHVFTASVNLLIRWIGEAVQ